MTAAIDLDDPDYEVWLANLARDCDCCAICWGRPCGGCQQGAPCDQARCRCWGENETDCGDQYQNEDEE